MARPRVLPSQRQRAAEACNFCRSVKKRCSGRVPCSTCLRRGIADSCEVVYRVRGSRGAPGEHGLPPLGSRDGTTAVTDPGSRDSVSGVSPDDSGGLTMSPPGSEPAESWQGEWAPPTPRPSHGWAGSHSMSQAWPASEPIRPEVLPALLGDSSLPARVTPANRLVVERRASISEPSTAIELQPRMLLNLRGEKVFIGGSASISFLQLVREIVSDHIGPTGFSHNETSESMLEVPSPPTNADRLIPPLGELDVEQKQRYSRAFCAVTEGLLDIFSASELESLIMGTRATDTTGISADKRATVELIIAVGAKCESPESANGHAKAYCRHAQQLVFADMLSSPSVDMVRTFILMAFYMLCECRRNTAFMYLGIAARAAVSLGLHSHFSYLDGSLRYRLRLRIWMSLCILDMLVSSLLGRPGATVGLRGDLDNSLAEISAAANNNQTQSVIASYRILSIITDTVEKIYEQKQMSRSVVEQQLAKIDSWRLSLPGDLLTNPVPASQGAAASHTGSIGKIHVSCLYYYAVTLATRPVLISTLTALLANGDPRHLQLAAACVDASVFMIQNCQEAYRAGIFLGNMCIIKALVFSAGLILGFEIFAKREMDYEIAAAFRGAGDVLSFLAAQSPQAAHYLDILTTLSRAILQQRENLSSRVKSGFVCKLLSIDSVKFRDRPGISASFPGHRRQGGGLIALAEASAAVRADSNGGLVENTIGIPVRNNGRQEESAMADGEVFFGLDSLDLSQWDKFPFLELDRGVT